MYGYDGRYVSRDEYNYYFREGFERGYEAGYYDRQKYGRENGCSSRGRSRSALGLL